MSAMPEPHLALSTLLEQAEVRGYLTTEDLMACCPDGTRQSLERILAYLEKQGIDVVDEHVREGKAAVPEEEVDTVGQYLKEMSRVPLLSAAEEAALARRVARGREAEQELKRHGRALPKARREALEALVEDGQEAREHLIRANTRLVVSIAKRYIGRGVPFADLIQEGNLGLMKAVDKFDYRRGFRFSTYATWWIRQTVTRAIADQGRTIRVPVHMLERIRILYRHRQTLEQRLGRPPTTEELAEAMDMPLHKVQWMLQVSWYPISLEAPVTDHTDEETELGAFIEDKRAPAPSQLAYQRILQERVKAVLETLPPREAQVIRLRYGLENGHPLTLEEIASKFGLTRERIRQIENKALRRLRHPSRTRQLRDYLD